MPAQHRRTYSAIYEMALAASFTVVPFIGGLLAGYQYAFRFLALPGGLAIAVVPALIYFVLPESPRWHLRKGHAQAAVDIVNRIIARSGNRVPPLTVAPLGDHQKAAREQLPPYLALFAPGQLRWTAVRIGRRAFALRHGLFPDFRVAAKGAERPGLRRQRASLGLTSIVYAASFFGKGFTGYLMELIGRRWTIAYALTGSLPGLFMMLLAH